MNFDQLILQVDKLKQAALPGEAAQMALAPYNRKTRDAAMRMAVNPKQSAVLVLLYPDENGTSTVLIKRNEYKGVHSAQISFPGGRKEEEDRDLLDTALREAQEEVGITLDIVDVIRPMSWIYIPPSNFYVQPYLAFCHSKPSFTPELSEVAELICVPLEEIFHPEKLQTGEFPTGMGFQVAAPYFDVRGHKVWGATAMMLAELKALLHL